MDLTREELNRWAEQVKIELGLQEFRLSTSQTGDIILDMIAVPKNSRKQGIGSEALKRLSKLADQYEKRIILTLGLKDSRWGTTSRERLKKFYRQFGFVPNTGRYKDFTISQSMYRNPKIMETKLTFKQWLAESPLPDEWDKTIYSAKNSFAKQIKYAKERAQKVGAGSSRVAFKIDYQGRPTILKIAKNKKGLAQNEQEVEALSDWYLKKLDLTIPIIDYDEENPQPTWLHVEFATKAKDSDFRRICGLNLVQAIGFACKMSGRDDCPYWNIPPVLNEDELMDNEFISSLVDYFGNYIHHPIGDYRRLANWGIYQGRPVIIDIGLSQEILKTFYMG